MFYANIIDFIYDWVLLMTVPIEPITTGKMMNFFNFYSWTALIHIIATVINFSLSSLLVSKLMVMVMNFK